MGRPIQRGRGLRWLRSPKTNSSCLMNTGCKGFCGGIAQVLSINFLSLKMSGVDAALALSLGLELRVTGGMHSMRRRILVIISPATLTTLVGHLRGGRKKNLKPEIGNLNTCQRALAG